MAVDDALRGGAVECPPRMIQRHVLELPEASSPVHAGGPTVGYIAAADERAGGVDGACPVDQQGAGRALKQPVAGVGPVACVVGRRDSPPDGRKRLRIAGLAQVVGHDEHFRDRRADQQVAAIGAALGTGDRPAGGTQTPNGEHRARCENVHPVQQFGQEWLAGGTLGECRSRLPTSCGSHLRFDRVLHLSLVGHAQSPVKVPKTPLGSRVNEGYERSTHDGLHDTGGPPDLRKACRRAHSMPGAVRGADVRLYFAFLAAAFLAAFVPDCPCAEAELIARPSFEKDAINGTAKAAPAVAARTKLRLDSTSDFLSSSDITTSRFRSVQSTLVLTLWSCFIQGAIATINSNSSSLNLRARQRRRQYPGEYSRMLDCRCLDGFRA
jgi:hypothetical protein